MSPLLGSSGGSSEYAYRGILDDWPTPFASTLSAQNTLGTLNPINFAIANLTITGLNYKARVIAENDNATVSINGGPFVSAKSTDPDAVFVRDNQTIQIKLQPTSGTKEDFNKSYTIPVKIGKRSGTWLVSTRLIDETPNNIIFNGLIDQQLGITTISNSVSIVGLETGFSFPISASANQTGDGTSIAIYKNGSLIGTSGTVANGDQIYLSTQTPNLYATTRTFNVQVGTFTTVWGLITRNAIIGINPFSFVGVSSANVLNSEYISSPITISGADPGPTSSVPDPTALLVSISGPNAFFEIRTGATGNPLRYTDPSAPTAPVYWQNGSNALTKYAFNGDLIKVKINSSSSYSTTVTGILTVSNQSASYIVTTRPAPIDTIPSAFTFTDLTGLNAQGRGVVVTSSPITLGGMTTGVNDFGTASIVPSGTTAGISPQFNINNSPTWISVGTTASVKSGDVIRLRLTTPNLPTLNGVTNANLLFRVDGTDTTSNLPLEGYVVNNAFQEDTWIVETLARSCPITSFSVANQTGINTNTDVPIDFTVGGYNTDCQMNVSVTSQSSNYNFTQLNGTNLVTPTKSLTNVAPGSTIRLSVRSSSAYITGVASTISVSNSVSGVTPSVGFNTSFNITTVADTTPWQLSLSASPTTIAIGSPTTLTWSSTNCTNIRSVSWSATPPTNVGSGSSSVTPASVGSITYTITAYVNPASNTYTTGTTIDPLSTPPNLRYATATATITVNEDYIPTLNPNTTIFSQISGVPRSTAITNTVVSGILTVTGISANISANVTGDTGAGFNSPFAPGSTTTNLISSGTAIKLQVAASQLYLAQTSAFITFTDPVGNPVETTREFRVTTAECVPSTSTILTFGGGPDAVSLVYYTGVQFTNTSGGAGELGGRDILLRSRSLASIVEIGSATNYYNTIYAPDTTAGFFQGSITTITWSELIFAIWDAFTSKAQRPPSQNEIASLLNVFKPSNYTGISIGLTPWITDLNSAAISNTAGIRDIITPIYNSCGPERAATVGTIQAAGVSYPIVT